MAFPIEDDNCAHGGIEVFSELSEQAERVVGRLKDLPRIRSS